MSKKFIKVENDKVTFIHYLPFDEKNGMGKTEEELLKEGYLVDEIPEAEEKEGMVAVMYYEPQKGFWYEYEEAPLSEYQQGYDQAVLDMIESGVL